MNVRLRIARRAFASLLGIVCLPALAEAQLIQIKTVPVAAGDQFLVFPSRNLGMAGVSIALDDPLLDPFVNPAKGVRNRGVQLFATPTFYTVTGHNGAGRTLPLAALLGGDRWFGGFAFAIQDLESSQGPFFQPCERCLSPTGGSTRSLNERSAGNTYVSGQLGRKLNRSGISLAASVFFADLDAVDGVDLLYPSSNIEQSGSVSDYRIGLLAELDGGRSFEALLLHNRFNARHEVIFRDWVSDPLTGEPRPVERAETNLDRNRAWGLHLGYVQPTGQSGARIGGILTANYQTHPEIPNYEIMNIPRDPGHSWAFDMGVGLSKSQGPTTFAFDVIYEPAWSATWAKAESATPTASGELIPPGGKTVENAFRFSNTIVRAGIQLENETAGFQLGLRVRTINYRMEQRDRIEESVRSQKESWAEWTPSWSTVLKLGAFQLRYAGRLTTGTGRPGLLWEGAVADRFSGLDAETANFIVAPGGPLTLQDEHVVTHQFAVTIPISE